MRKESPEVLSDSHVIIESVSPRAAGPELRPLPISGVIARYLGVDRDPPAGFPSPITHKDGRSGGSSLTRSWFHGLDLADTGLHFCILALREHSGTSREAAAILT
jgi:hypothetical protein